MAIWHFRVNFVPKESLMDVYGAIPSVITEDEIIQLKPWEKRFLDYKILDNIASESKTWAHRIRLWGDEKTDNIRVVYADRNKEDILWIEAAVDMRGEGLITLSDIVSLAQLMDCVLFLTSNECFEADLDILTSYVQNSLAYKFTQNPQKALEDFHEDRMNNE